MKADRRIRSRIAAWSLVLAAILPELHPSVSPAAETAKVTTGDWRIYKPSREFRGLPKLLPKEQSGFDVGIGQIEFVCRKTTYYMLLVQPSLKLRDVEQGAITLRAGTVPSPLIFRNLYKTKSPLSRSLDLDADIHHAEISAALLASIAEARDLELTLADRSYTIALSDLGSRLGAFQRFCEKGVVENPAYFVQP